MKILKDLFKSTVISIGMALSIFSLVCVVFDVMNKGSFALEGYRLTKMVIGSVLVGLGFGVPTVVYNIESLPMPIRVVIHMGIGCAVYTAVAYSTGWLGGAATVKQGIIIAAVQLAVAFIIWLCFSCHYRKEAKQMNEKIREMKR